MAYTAIPAMRPVRKSPETPIPIGPEKVCPMGSALVPLGAVGFTLVAAYQWAGRVGGFWHDNDGVRGARLAKPRGAPQSP